MCVCVCSFMSYKCRRLNALQFPWVPLARWAGDLEGDPNTHFVGHQSLDLCFILTVLGVTHYSTDFFTETIVLVSAKILDLDTL